ncbi:MAG: hypothetical protein R2729_28140 [Bryobacteraceae bacterium]
MSGRFQYRLQTLLDQKARAQEEAERALGDKQRDLRVERERLEEENGKLAAVQQKREAFRRETPAEMTADTMRYRADYLRGLGQDVELAKDAVYAQRFAVEEAEERVEEARSALARATREAEVLRKHREKAETRWRREQERAAELEQEEIGSVLHEARRRSG